MAQSANDLKIIHLRKLATPNRKYYGDDEKVYLGNSNGSLRLLDDALYTKFESTLAIEEDNVQEAIEYINNRLVQRGKQIEIDFGNIPYLKQQVFNILDQDITDNNKIIASLAYEAPSNKSLDELEMDDLLIKCKANNGSIDLLITSLGASLTGKFKINYIINY